MSGHCTLWGLPPGRGSFAGLVVKTVTSRVGDLGYDSLLWSEDDDDDDDDSNDDFNNDDDDDDDDDGDT